MFKSLIAKFMAKTLLTKIVIVTSSVVIIGGATAGAIIIPKQIEIKREEERQEQIRIENEKDLENMSIVLSQEEFSLPLNGVTRGITIERNENLESLIPYNAGDNIEKDKLSNVLTEMFVESYTGGELTIDIDPNINRTTRGDYQIIFTVTSEKGNTKSVTAIISVVNFFKPGVYAENTEITITKGTEVDIMKGVTFESNLPEEEQGHIEAIGTVDVNAVGTYTITYKYIPKEGTDETPLGEATRTYKVVEEKNIIIGKQYTYRIYNENYNNGYADDVVIFKSNNKVEYYAVDGMDHIIYTGTYTIKDGIITANVLWHDEMLGEDSKTIKFRIENQNRIINIGNSPWLQRKGIYSKLSKESSL